MENETPQMVPSLSEMTSRDFTTKEWLRYYSNVWKRQLLARVCDMQFDMIRDGEEETDEEVLDAVTQKPRFKKTKERLQERKAKVQAALELIATFELVGKVLEETGDEGFAKTYLAPEVLKIDESVFEVPQEGPKVGESCETMDNKKGTWQDNGDGNMICIPVEPTSETPAPDEAPEEPSAEAQV